MTRTRSIGVRLPPACIDISTEAIEHARQAAAAAELAVELHVGELRGIPTNGGFDAVVCMGSSFGYLDLAGTRQFVAALAATLRAGGGLVIDYSVAAESVLPGFTDEQPRNITVGDITATCSNTYDVVNSRLISTYLFRRGDQKFEATALHHIYTIAHLHDLLTTAGFTDIQLFSGPDREPFKVGSGRVLLTARSV